MLKLDREKLLPILKNFHTLTKLNVAIYSEEMEEIAFYPGNRPFCEYLHNSTASDVCIQSNMAAFNECERTKKPVFYKCPFKIWDTVTPLVYENRIIGYVMVGQGKDSEDPRQFQETAPQNILNEYSLDSNVLAPLHNSLPTMSKDFISASVELIALCVSHLHLQNIIYEQTDTFKRDMEAFIQDNLADTITVEMLCKQFLISRANLYRFFRRHYNMGVSEYICEKRIARAKKLLTSTQTPIREIAELCGIPDYYYFNKVFLKQVGTTPYKFRKNKI